ncbi:hypothetical protein Pyn_33649 [Prunus yedoensis var. nudiflora]|uniref:Uncharacterized protein n=1 Tax=Prunus yedoensis var. nudiflora TaxID=2094558 RepID=A0A314ZGS0_PRUYE|nr:hypothetical protein Pyn_33649 [Prunus yedoensis var. nudiflora]
MVAEFREGVMFSTTPRDLVAHASRKEDSVAPSAILCEMQIPIPIPPESKKFNWTAMAATALSVLIL